MKTTRFVVGLAPEVAKAPVVGWAGIGLLVLIGVPLALSIDVARWATWQLGRLRMLRTPALGCACGARVVLFGGWICPSCRHTFEGHGFLPCRVCDDLADVTCSCQRTLTNPLRALRP